MGSSLRGMGFVTSLGNETRVSMVDARSWPPPGVIFVSVACPDRVVPGHMRLHLMLISAWGAGECLVRTAGMLVVSMGVGGCGRVPAVMVAVVRASCPRGTRVTRLRDALGAVFTDARFAGWFAAQGRPGVAPGLLALVCVLQAMDDLSDRRAADAVRTRLDWKYALVPGADRSRVRLLGVERVP